MTRSRVALLSAWMSLALLLPPARTPADEGSDSRHVRVMAVGDIMLDAVARPVMEQFGYDHAFAQTKSLFETADIVFGNLEGPLTNQGTPQQDKTFVFRSPPQQVATALKRAGFNVVSLANNHSMDYGVEGLQQTAAALDLEGIQHAGAGDNSTLARAPALIRLENGIRIAVLAYSLTYPESFWAGPHRPGTAFGHEANVREDVHNASAVADIVLVSFHWGRESQTELRDYQVQLGHAAIDAGAGAVIGHHPHILQAVEYYNQGVIFYSLGNFAFGSRSRKSLVSAIAELDFEGAILRRVRMLPLNVDNIEVQYQPTPLSGAEADGVVTHIIELSRVRATELSNVDGSAVLEIPR